jgi:uncharacterized integral membrane protein
MKNLKLILGGIVVACFVIMAIQNAQTITLRFLFWEFSASQIILIPLILLFGVAAGYLIGRGGRTR